MSRFQARPFKDPLARQQAEVERRRQRDRERTVRFLHNKTRLIGVDKQALDAQVEERRRREQMEKHLNLQYDAVRLQHAQAALSLKRQHEQMLAEERANLRSVHEQQAREKLERDILRIESDHQLPLPSEVFLNFRGEDRGVDERLALQKQQQREWLQQQIMARRAKEQQEQKEASQYDAYQAYVNGLRNEEESKIDAEKARLRRELQAMNKQLQRDKEARDKARREAEDQAGQVEVTNALQSALLNEDVPLAAGSDKPVSYHFKGFTEMERQRILDDQARQVAEKRRLQKAQEDAERAYARQQEAINQNRKRAAALQAEMLRREQQGVALFNQAQARDKHIREAHLNNTVYTNPVTDEFFEQFGKSCR